MVEGPSRKRQEVGSSSAFVTSIASYIATLVSVSTGSRLTTATIRGKMKGALTVEQKMADKKLRTAGKVKKSRAIKNPNVTPCPKRIEKGKYDPENPHSSSYSKSCPNHKINIDQYIEFNVGKKPERYVRKHGLQELVK